MKPHYPILDGLRGTAAILVVLYHLFQAYYPDLTKHPLPHGYLAVDFFYLLSGFVVGYAYDDRWAKGMTVKHFLKIRLIRLHPLLVLGTILGALCFFFNPYKDTDIVNIVKLIGVTIFGICLLPVPMNNQGTGNIYPLNGPCWSLLQEYIANILYAVIGRKLSSFSLLLIVIISGILLTIVSIDHNGLNGGWGYALIKSPFIAHLIYGANKTGYPNVWLAPVRMLFPFCAGLLLSRINVFVKISMAYTVCSLLLLLTFIFPLFSWNGYFEAVIVMGVFPLIVAIGAGGQIKGKWAKLCKLTGQISYPIYIMHYPFIYIYTFWVLKTKPTAGSILTIGIGLLFFLILLAYASFKLYDKPLGAWLREKYL